jgi:hypothetical protein
VGRATLAALEMVETPATRVLVVAHRTAATPKLMEAVRARAQRGRCAFTLLVPRPYWDPDTEEAALVLELALPLLEEAAGSRVEAIVGDPDPFVAVEHAIAGEKFDEVIVSTLPERVSHWLRRDLPSRVAALGVPVTTVTADTRLP